MKRILTLTVLAMYCAALTAQSVFPTPADPAIWHLNKNSFGDPPSPVTVFVPPGEVQACGQTWSLAQTYSTLPGGQNSAVSTIGYYRQEDQRVYFRQSLNCADREYLMYDFSLETGDSAWVGIPGLYLNADTVLMHVFNTSTFCRQGIERKSLTLIGYVPNPFGSFPPIEIILQWLEGVGDVGIFSQHPFYSGVCFLDSNCEESYQIQCMETLQGTIYGNPGSLCSNSFRLIYVDASVGSSLNNGLSWNTAFRKLQDAIAIAEAGDTILVAQGTYFPTDDADREKHFLLKNGVVMLGGYQGTECLSSERDPVLYETILSGDIGVPNDSTDNSYHVLYANGVDSTALLDGFTVTRGYAIHPTGNAYFGHLNKGGALYLRATADVPFANPRIQNCKFILNTGQTGGAFYCDGGADHQYADPVLENCVFDWNRSLAGGGAIYKNVASHPNHAFRVSNCSFGYNRAAASGGAIYFLSGGNRAIFSNTHFHHNTSVSSGGAVLYQTFLAGTSIQMNHCSFTENEARSAGAIAIVYLGSNLSNDAPEHILEIAETAFTKNYGHNSTGGAVIVYSESSNRCSVSIRHSVFEENYSIYEGGGIYIENSNGAVVNLHLNYCHFIRNHSLLGVAAAIYMRGGLSSNLLPSLSTMAVTNTLFSNNDGAFAVLSGVNGAAESIVQNCTFYNNGEFPIIKNWNSNFNDSTFYNRMEIANSVIWEPEAIPGRLFYNNSLANPSLYDYNLHHNLISAPDCALPGGDVACGEGNIFAVWPAFLDTLNDDFHLAACSPAINAGTNEGLATLLTDLDGNPRILEGVADMGAYERHAYRIDSVSVSALTCFGDSNGRVSFNLNGNAPYAYNWENTAGQIGTSSEDLRAGSYQFSITDALGCSDTISVQLSQPESMEASFVIGNASSAVAADGSIALEMLSGGTPPYRFFWSTGDTTNSLSNLLPGFYELAILDANDCTQSLSFEVSFTNAASDIGDSWQLQVSPNPFRSGERLHIWQSGAIPYDLEIKILDAQGRQVADFQLNNEVVHLDTQVLPAGIYSLQWRRMDGRYGTLKIVVL